MSTLPTRRPSNGWVAISVVCGLLTAVALIAAILFQSSASEPIGEGEVFIVDADKAMKILDDSTTPETGVRHARNLLDVEAVSILNSEGIITASTSDHLVGEPASSPLLVYGAATGRFAALAARIPQGLEIDGVEEWAAESILYQVVSPLSQDSGSILLHYDVAQLLSRRVQPGEIQTETIQLLALAGVFGLLGVAVVVGHARASRRYRDLALESQLMRAHSEELKATNLELADARRSAERALAFSEEKMRIRAEFVLMINHELRTPLTTVVTGAELVRAGGLSDVETTHVLDAMVSDGARLQEIIDQVLAVARIENRGLSYDLVDVPLAKVCEATRGTHARVTPDQIREIHEGTIVRTDLSTLALVVASLVGNARTHGASNVSVDCSIYSSIDPMVEVGRRPHHSVFLRVSDDGPGIDPEFLPRAFEKFEKQSFSSGTGLGLYMARLMVEALDGSLSVHTSPEGTTFQIAIPTVKTTSPLEAV